MWSSQYFTGTMLYCTFLFSKKRKATIATWSTRYHTLCSDNAAILLLGTRSNLFLPPLVVIPPSPILIQLRWSMKIAETELSASSLGVSGRGSLWGTGSRLQGLIAHFWNPEIKFSYWFGIWAIRSWEALGKYPTGQCLQILILKVYSRWEISSLLSLGWKRWCQVVDISVWNSGGDIQMKC